MVSFCLSYVKPIPFRFSRSKQFKKYQLQKIIYRCKQLSKDPTSTGCDVCHFGCKSCLEIYFKQKNGTRCPACNTYVVKNGMCLKPNVPIKNLMDDTIHMKCEYCKSAPIKLEK